MPRYSAEDLDQEVHSRLLVVRVTDETSLSPRCRNDDFVATSSEFDPHPDNEDWSLYYQGKFLNWTSLTRRDVDSVVEHVTGGWNYWGFGKSSPWISTSADLDWSIWEIARRLVRLDRDEVELSVIRRKHAKNYRGLKSVRIDTFDVLRLHEKDNYYHSDLDDAMNFARASDEVLFCGRIFGKDVLETTTWTYYVSL